MSNVIQLFPLSNQEESALEDDDAALAQKVRRFALDVVEKLDRLQGHALTAVDELHQLGAELDVVSFAVSSDSGDHSGQIASLALSISTRLDVVIAKLDRAQAAFSR